MGGDMKNWKEQRRESVINQIIKVSIFHKMEKRQKMSWEERRNQNLGAWWNEGNNKGKYDQSNMKFSNN